MKKPKLIVYGNNNDKISIVKRKNANKSEKTISELLAEFQQKAGAWQSQNKAISLKNKLEKVLLVEEYNELNTAHNHYSIGEGAEELYQICNKLLTKYK